MSKKSGIALCVIIGVIFIISSAYKSPAPDNSNIYRTLYFNDISGLEAEFNTLHKTIDNVDPSTVLGRKAILNELYVCRKQLKRADFWTRYLEANTYRSLNGPIPVEWEIEVFEKFEKPYKRLGFGLTILENAIDSNVTDKELLNKMILPSVHAMPVYKADSVTKNLDKYDHFFLCNRLFLLNLAAIYTTGFECPDNDSIIPELRIMLIDVGDIYKAYNSSFTQNPLPPEYLEIYNRLKLFAASQSSDSRQFDHYAFIHDYVNPLFGLNQQYIRNYKIISNSLYDYTLNNNATSIFDKDLYRGQNALGIYSGISNPKLLGKIKQIGKLLFYDPILSGNNQRSCASCHKPTECFTDTSVITALKFDGVKRLPRNTPSLVNVTHNHLLMFDGKHTSLQNQAKGVMTNRDEMCSKEDDIVKKVLSCKQYKTAFTEFKKYTYKNKQITFDHIISAITTYLQDFNNFIAPFDDYMNGKKEASPESKEGFNIYMGKAQCGTCHYIPEFSGIRPPFVSSEFEVIGVPSDTKANRLDADSGRAGVYFSDEMFHAFRTNTIRNSGYTKPYMHNGIYTTMQEVLDFYNEGGGAGKGLKVENQTLSAHPLHLTKDEMNKLLAFIKSLDENIPVETPPDQLPVSKDKSLNSRKIGGVY